MKVIVTTLQGLQIIEEVVSVTQVDDFYELKMNNNAEYKHAFHIDDVLLIQITN